MSALDSRSFISLWSQEQMNVQEASAEVGDTLGHTASRQLRKAGIAPGNRIYVVATDHFRLILVGRLTVDELLDYDEAQERLGFDAIYEAPDHAIGTGTPIVLDRHVPPEIVAQLERVSGKLISPPGEDGAVTGMALRTTGQITDESAQLLDGFLESTDSSANDSFQVDITVPERETFTEGQRHLALGERLERSKEAVNRAVAIHGTACVACGFSFRSTYGEHGDGYIEVHHLKMLATEGKREVDARSDLTVLCSNCHRMVHRRNPPLEIHVLKAMLAAQGG